MPEGPHSATWLVKEQRGSTLWGPVYRATRTVDGPLVEHDAIVQITTDAAPPAVRTARRLADSGRSTRYANLPISTAFETDHGWILARPHRDLAPLAQLPPPTEVVALQLGERLGRLLLLARSQNVPTGRLTLANVALAPDGSVVGLDWPLALDATETSTSDDVESVLRVVLGWYAPPARDEAPPSVLDLHERTQERRPSPRLAGVVDVVRGRGTLEAFVRRCREQHADPRLADLVAWSKPAVRVCVAAARKKGPWTGVSIREEAPVLRAGQTNPRSLST